MIIYYMDNDGVGARRGSALLGTLQVSLLGRRSVYVCVIVLLVHGRVCLCVQEVMFGLSKAP